MPIPQDSDELRRILALPRRPQAHSSELAEALTKILRRPGGTQTLWPIQATALHEMWRCRGLLAPIDVGEGKTLITLLGPLVMGATAPILLLPANLIDKTRHEMAELNRHWKIPNHIRIYSYELLGRADHVHLLDMYPPCDLLLADECQRIRNPSAAVSKRVKRFFQKNPNVPFVALSGSICKQSLHDYEHLARWALKDGSPLPANHGELEDWADAIDEHDRERPDPGALRLLSGGSSNLSAVRRGYRSRLVETPGVVASVQHRLPVSITLRGVRYPQGQAITDAFTKFRESEELPDGTEMVDGMEIWRHARELALGFWSRWDPPAPDEWRLPRRAWAKVLRAILGNSRTLDSELAVVRAIDEDKHPHARPILEAWRAVKDSFEPNTVPVWIDDTPLQFAARWGRDTPGGVVWCDHVPFAKELAKRTNWPYYGAGGVTEGGNSILGHTPGATCIVSRQSVATGYNLQWAHRALVTAVLANDTQSEQLYGRHHRPGQRHDVTYELMLGCREHLEAFWKARRQAHMVYETMGTENKILYANIDNIPTDVNNSMPQWARKDGD